MFSKTTNRIKITVLPTYLGEHSSPDDEYFVWAYNVQIENLSAENVQLLSRRWDITDSYGHRQEITGSGVVGKQPIIEPGTTFSYTSGTPLHAPSGFMVGSYQMSKADGERFDVDIPAFSLDSPEQAKRPN